jgi:hypothetical protein
MVRASESRERIGLVSATDCRAHADRRRPRMGDTEPQTAVPTHHNGEDPNREDAE